MKFKYAFILLILFSEKVSSQEVICNTGEFWNNSEGSLSWTLGEVITETFTSTNHELTQGFQQIQEGYLGFLDIINSDNLTIYPNPFISEVNIQMNEINSDFLITIFDYQSKIVLHKNILFSTTSNRQTIDLSSLAAGYYYFEIINSTNDIRSIQRLIKLKDAN